MVLFMVNVLGYNELWAAIGMIPAAFTSMVLTPFSGRLVDRLGPRQLAAAGTVLFAVAFALFSQMRADSTIWDIAWRGVIMGTAMSLHMPALTAAGLTSLPSRSSGVGSGMISMGRQVGTVIGVALLLSVYGQTAWQGAANAAERATAYVTMQERLEPSIREEIAAIVTETTREHGAAAAAGSFDLGPPVTEALEGRVDSGTLAAISADLTAMTDDEQSRAFMWPFLIPGIVALLYGPRVGVDLVERDVDDALHLDGVAGLVEDHVEPVGSRPALHAPLFPEREVLEHRLQGVVLGRERRRAGVVPQEGH